MSVRAGKPGTGTDRAVLAVIVVTAVVTAVAVLWPATDLGRSWTFVVTYGGVEVSRQTIDLERQGLK